MKDVERDLPKVGQIVELAAKVLDQITHSDQVANAPPA